MVRHRDVHTTVPFHDKSPTKVIAVFSPTRDSVEDDLIGFLSYLRARFKSKSFYKVKTISHGIHRAGAPPTDTVSHCKYNSGVWGCFMQDTTYGEGGDESGVGWKQKK